MFVKREGEKADMAKLLRYLHLGKQPLFHTLLFRRKDVFSTNFSVKLSECAELIPRIRNSNTV